MIPLKPQDDPEPIAGLYLKSMLKVNLTWRA
jgi:hypothetical protein